MNRNDFGARNKAEAKRTAHSIVSRLLESYFDVGQPGTDADDDVPEADIERLHAALLAIQAVHERRAAR